MAEKNPNKAQAESTGVRKVLFMNARRGTTPVRNQDERSDTVKPNIRRKLSTDSGNNVRRKLSVDNGHRNLFPKLSRSSYDDVLPAEHWTSSAVDQPVKLQMGERELSQKPITIMSVLRLNVEKYPERNAYAYKSDGTWNYVTYKNLLELVIRAAKGFISFGLQRYYGVAIIGRNTLEWAIANFAAIYAGGIVVPISATIPADVCCDIMQNTRCSILVVGSSKQLDKFAELRHQMFYIKAVIKYGKDSDTTSVSFHTWEQLLAMGDHVDDERLKERIAYQGPNLCCTILHTPGTTGPSKPVMLSQDNFVWTSRTMGRRLSCSVASGVVVSIMSYSHVSGLIFDLYVPMLFASTVYFISSPNVFEWTKEVQPTMFFSPILIFDELRVKLTSQLTRSCFSRIIFWWAKIVGLRGYRAMTRRRPMPLCWPLANALVYRKIRTKLGVQNSREIFMSGRTISVEALQFFASLNIPALEIYGATECAGPVTVSSIPEMFRLTSVGKDIDGCTTIIIKPDEDGVGDLRIRGRNVFMGYLNQPEMTNEAFDADGWLKTGDLARKDDDGFLYIIGKIAELVILENGAMIAPEPIETRVKEAIPFIRNCMLVGQGRPYLATLMSIKTVVNWQTFEVSSTLTPDSREWFRKMGYEDEGIENFLLNPNKRIMKRIQTTIDRLNATEEPSHRILRWTILPKDFSVGGGELNWIFKPRRFFIEQKYAETIDSLFTDK